MPGATGIAAINGAVEALVKPLAAELAPIIQRSRRRTVMRAVAGKCRQRGRSDAEGDPRDVDSEEPPSR
jgi:hypothetical protein